MGIKRLAKCSFNFCTERAVKEGRCHLHPHKSISVVDPFYSNPKWLSASKGYLAKHPLCVKCAENGRIEPATVVDHKVPWKKGGDKWRPANWAPLCASCHGLKRSYENAERYLKFYEGCDLD